MSQLLKTIRQSLHLKPEPALKTEVKQDTEISTESIVNTQSLDFQACIKAIQKLLNEGVIEQYKAKAFTEKQQHLLRRVYKVGLDDYLHVLATFGPITFANGVQFLDFDHVLEQEVVLAEKIPGFVEDSLLALDNQGNVLDLKGDVTGNAGNVINVNEPNQVLYPSFVSYLSAMLQTGHSVSLESCCDCGGSLPSNTTINSNTQGNTGFTYNEGKGEKEVVQLTGPLSEIYTRALNLYYSKKPVLEENTIPENITEHENEMLMQSAMIAKESFQHEQDQMKVVLTEILKEKEYLDEYPIHFLHENVYTEIEDKPDTVVVMTDSKGLESPIVIDNAHQHQKHAKEVLLMVTDEKRFMTQGMGVRNRLIQLACPAPKTALESYYENAQLKIVYGFEGLVEYLRAKRT